MHGVARSFALLSVGGLMLCAAMAGGVLAQDDAQARRLYALAREKTNIAEKDKLKAEEFTWRVPMKGNHQVEAMALCDDGLLVAGGVWDPQSTRVTGFLWVVSLQDGKTTAEFPLDAPPTLDGLAVANQRIYVSLQNGAVVCFGKEG